FQLTVVEVCVGVVFDNPVGSPQAGAPPIVKFVLEISKKIFPTASTFTRQVELGDDGTVITSEPSLAVAAANTVGNVSPPSVDNKILTVAQLTDPALVPFTFHVTDAELLSFQVTAVFGAVTANGPAVLVTVTTTSVNAV